MYGVPVLLDSDSQKVVGSISLNQEIEKLLSEGITFVLGASIMVESNHSRKVVGVTLSNIPVKNEVEWVVKKYDALFDVKEIKEKDD